MELSHVASVQGSERTMRAAMTGNVPTGVSGRPGPSAAPPVERERGRGREAVRDNRVKVESWS